jgi:acyl-CoA synthetase (AMP-forming)/AMP-acid ligase II
MEGTLGQAFARSARKYPKKIAVKDDESSLTYAAFNGRVNKWANVLSGLGIQRGENIATLSNNCIPLMEVYLGNLKAGMVTVPLNARGLPEDIVHQIVHTDCEIVVFEKDFIHAIEAIKDQMTFVKHFISIGGKTPAFAVDYEGLLSKSSDAEPENIGIVEDDSAVILHTGGTTGTPKGAVLTHKNLLWNAICGMSENRTNLPEEIIFYAFQMNHVAAYSRFIAFMYGGGTYIASKSFEPDKYLDMNEQERTTIMIGSPTTFRMLLQANRKRKRNLSSVSKWICSQAFFSRDFVEEIQRDLIPNAKFYGFYGLTEASPAVTVLKPEDEPRAWGSVGRPYICTEVRIVNDQDEDMPVGQEGQIIVKGPTVFKGYYKNHEETERTLQSGWLHTGDAGKYDDLGYVYMADRIKDMIKSGGLNVYSREVEEVLAFHPDIAEAIVIGYEDQKWGESVRALVVQKPGARLTENDVIEHCRHRLASYKKPTSVVFLDTIPKDAMGKPLKRVAREKYGK